MKPEELRIGNYYRTFDGTIEGYRIEQLTLKDFAYISEAGGDFCDYGFEPVPLDEEVLLSLDFRKVNGYGFNLNGIRLIKCKYDNSFEFTEFRSKPIYLNYLHELQNLYFALTGEELKIK